MKKSWVGSKGLKILPLKKYLLENTPLVFASKDLVFDESE